MLDGNFNCDIMLDLIHEIYFVLDRKLRILFSNKAASALLNIDAGNLKGKPVNNLLQSEYWNILHGLPDKPLTIADDNLRFVLPDNRKLYAHLKTVKSETCCEYYFQILLQNKKKFQNDVSENKMIEQQIANVYKLGSIGTLAAGIAHEIGNPLTSISSVVQMIKRTTKEKFTCGKLDLVKTQITRISNIIHQLVEFSNPSGGSLKPTDVNKLLESAVNMVKMGRGTNNIRFVYELKPGLPSLHVVPDQLLHVFLNLIMNAVDSLENKNGNIWLNTFKDDGSIEVVIRDTVRGIPKKNLDRIFEPFFSTKVPGKGIGLGLWVITV